MVDASLMALTPYVRRHMEECEKTSHGGVAKAVVEAYRRSGKREFPESTLRRRIYDVVTVFCVIGYVQKVEKTLVWVGHLSQIIRPFHKDLEQAKRRVQSKEQALQSKMRLFMAYQVLLATNRDASKTENVRALPTIVLGQRGPPWKVQNVSPANPLTIEADVRPKVFSPFDILSCRTFSDTAIALARRSLPDSPLVAELFPA
jgi:hypothetical protein